MQQKNSLILTLSKDQSKEIESYCRLNELDVDTFLSDCFIQGFLIEKNGLLNPLKTGGVQEKWVEKEVIREKRVEVPVEVIKEIIKEVPVEKVVEKIVEITKEIPVEKIVIQEVVKEIPIEKVVEKEIFITDDKQVNELLLKIQQLENEKNELLLKIQQLKDECSKKPSVDGSKQQALQETIQKLMGDNKEKSDKILQLEKSLLELESMAYQKGILLRSSNLNDNLYK